MNALPPLSPLAEMKAAVASMKTREADHRRGSEDETIKADTIMYERLSLEERIDLIETRAKEATVVAGPPFERQKL